MKIISNNFSRFASNASLDCNLVSAGGWRNKSNQCHASLAPSLSKKKLNTEARTKDRRSQRNQRRIRGSRKQSNASGTSHLSRIERLSFVLASVFSFFFDK